MSTRTTRSAKRKKEDSDEDEKKEEEEDAMPQSPTKKRKTASPKAPKRKAAPKKTSTPTASKKKAKDDSDDDDKSGSDEDTAAGTKGEDEPEKKQESVILKEDKKKASSPSKSIADLGKGTESGPDIDYDLRSELLIEPSKYGSEQEWSAKFGRIADVLLNHIVLVAGKHKLRICEVEFYFTCSNHNDPYTHCDSVQETPSNWYFHRQNGKSYKSGTYMGLDISIGNSKSEAGGILIRAIDTIGGEFVTGPSKSVEDLLKKTGQKAIIDLVDNIMKGDIGLHYDENKEKPLYLATTNQLKMNKLIQHPVYTSGRVGLNMTKSKEKKELQKQYLFKNYRFFTNPKLNSKGKHYMILAMKHQGKSESEISKIVGCTAARVKKICEACEKGKGKDTDTFLSKKLTTDDDVADCYGAIISDKSNFAL